MTVAIAAPEGVLLAHYGDLLCGLLGEKGVAEDIVLAGTGLTRAQLQEPGRRMSLAATLQLLRNVRAIDPSPDLGVRLGAPLNIGSHGFLGYAFQSSRNLGEAFDLAVRFLRTRTSLFDIRIERDGKRAALVLEERYDLGDLTQIVADAVITSILAIGQQMFGVMLAHRVTLCLPYAEQQHHQGWRKKTGLNLQFGRAWMQLQFPAALLDMSISTADPTLAALAAARCEEELRQAGESNDIVSRVRDIARRHLTDENSLEKVAGELHLTTRTLRRRLQQAGTSYQSLIEQMRRRLAVHYLLHSQRSVDDIAAVLGYSDPSNFARAFRRWTGESPREYRQQHRKS
ncbi:AraC family transcriptional regulator [Alcanivorax sp. 1008]|uniref:AraC family transcriptional regulator n=1 Tax=Alcanivorax sp. 1008 TaxID=2816853 RepID=UPI001D81D5B8|nr:AraC family transcriptional regulator [Alcanivorax sp. 1008]MCC1497569.1 AraC family transcriptional regulator [Alcanivorax sp. 1008]